MCCVVPGPSQWFFHFGEEIVIARTHIGSVRWLFLNLPLPTAQEVYDNSSGVSPCIVMKNDGVLYHQMSLFSLELWTRVVLQERAVVGSVYCVPWRFSITPSLSYATLKITFTAQCVGRTIWDGGNRDYSIYLIRVSSLVRMREPRFSCTAMIRRSKSSPSLWYRFNKACATTYGCHCCTSEISWGIQRSASLR